MARIDSLGPKRQEEEEEYRRDRRRIEDQRERKVEELRGKA